MDISAWLQSINPWLAFSDTRKIFLFILPIVCNDGTQCLWITILRSTNTQQIHLDMHMPYLELWIRTANHQRTESLQEYPWSQRFFSTHIHCKSIDSHFTNGPGSYSFHLVECRKWFITTVQNGQDYVSTNSSNFSSIINIHFTMSTSFGERVILPLGLQNRVFILCIRALAA